MPQLLYVLHNASVWLPQRYFYLINRVFRELIWGRGHARIKLETLQQAKDEGGLAVPNPFIYFLAAQLQHIRGYDADTSDDPIAQLLQYHCGTSNLYEALESKRFSGNLHRYPTLNLLLKLWWKMREMANVTGCTPYTAISGTPWLPELGQLTGFEAWKAGGYGMLIKLRTAMPLTRLVPIDLIQDRTHARGLISALYKHLLYTFHLKFPATFQARWEGDVGHIEQNIWDEILSMVPKRSLDEQHRLSQIYLIHRVAPLYFCTKSDYRTPHYVLDAIYILQNCSICSGTVQNESDIGLRSSTA